ncbi:hypothetical protein [Halodurantibacterium flavum]|uniref:Secreted protein n=1 Tax=Halodurantibacterium flavum TaxID=1382802 RepID=A0ABW4SBI9_9RHOB
MIELIFVACLATDPSNCREHTHMHMPGVTVQSCMMQAQPQLAQWVSEHPSMIVTRWSCASSEARKVRV